MPSCTPNHIPCLRIDPYRMRFAAASTLKITYGYTAKKEDDELLQIANTAMEEFSLALAPGAYLADLILIRLWSLLHFKCAFG